MRVISKKTFVDAARIYPNDKAAIMAAYRVLETENFVTPDHLRAKFPSLDKFKFRNKWWVINIGGNNLRLIAYANFETQQMFIKHIVTHKEYDRLTDYYRRTKE